MALKRDPQSRRSVKQPYLTLKQNDVFGAFEFRARSEKATALIKHLHIQILETEQRQRQRKQNDAERFYDTVERFVGELLQAKAREGERFTGRFGRAMSARGFSGDIVGYDNVRSVRDALKKLGFLIHTVGSPSYNISFDHKNKHDQSKGEAAKFEATQSLVSLAEGYGVSLTQIDRHFPVEHQPIEARKPSSGSWQGKQQGRKVRFAHTPQTLAMEARVTAVNEFLRGFKIAGADHRMFYRLFNECDDVENYRWNKGGRLYSDSGNGTPSYQSMSIEPKRRRALRSAMTIDGEEVVELDLAASYLTIFHALAGRPLSLSLDEDPYSRIGADRDLVKGWMTVSFGAGKLCEKWSSDFSARYADQHEGVRPTNVLPATAIRDKALEAYPSLSRIGDSGLCWSDLMYVESEVILKAMEALMVGSSVPSLPVHDALMVSASDAAEGARALYLSFYSIVGALPVIKTKSSLPGVKAAVEAVWDEIKDLEIKPPEINTRLFGA